MSYEKIDPILNAWAARHGLQVYSTYKETEVRSVRLYGHEPEYVGIAVDPPRPESPIVVRVGLSRRRWRENRCVELNATVGSLDTVLEEAYALATNWLKEAS
jgi:hypothetical protein